MVLRVSTFKSVKDFTDYYQSGVTLKSQALKIWLKRKGYPQSFVAERLGISKNKFRRMLFKRQRFNKSEMTALIHLMGARAAIDMVWFQSLQEKKRIQKDVWEGQMSNKNNFEFSNNFETPKDRKKRAITEHEKGGENWEQSEEFENLIFDSDELPSRRFMRRRNV